ncbi:MAG: membrane integrity-associated transporter subunit PqiC [Betaproteobacteria bacterium]|nr:membrane integrity-associated transporter subunit PqiC [Betaproteobacteria bacterium]
MGRPEVLAVLCAAAMLAAGCGTTPPSRFYTLSATAAPTASPTTLVVAVGPVTVPAVVDRPEFVLSASPNELRIDDFNRWASPLQDNLSRAVAENLVAILGTPRVILFPQPLATSPDYRVAIEVRTFDSTPAKSAALDAVWTIRQTKDGKTRTGRTSARETPADGGYEALAAAHSQAVARLSGDIAEAILAMQRGSP